MRTRTQFVVRAITAFSAALLLAGCESPTTPHLAGEMFKLRTGIDATHVPYKGIGASFTDMMSGKVQMAASAYDVIGPGIWADGGDWNDRDKAGSKISRQTG